MFLGFPTRDSHVTRDLRYTQAMLLLMCTKRFRNSTVKHASDFNTATGQSMRVTTFDLETAMGKLSKRGTQRCAMFFSLSFFSSF